MSSAVPRRNSCRGSLSGRFEVAGATRQRSASEGAARWRRGSEDPAPARLKQPILAITLRFLLAIDLWLSRRLGVCACEGSPWGGVRPLVRLVELSGHGVPWFVGTAYGLLRGDTATEQEVMLNLAFALLLDLLLVRLVKTIVRRRRPPQNRSDIFSAFFAERYSFPSGHATRAAMCARFLLAQLGDTASMRALVLGWAAVVSLSRLLLARHFVTDVGFGLAMGYCQYSLVERLWVTWERVQELPVVLLGERLDKI